MKQKLLSKVFLLLFALVAGSTSVWADDLTFSLTSNPGGWPTANSTTLTNYTYTLDEVDYTFALNNVKCNSGYLMMTSTAVLGLPAIEGYKLTKVVASNSSGCSTSTLVGISSSSSSASYITGGETQKWSTTGSSYTYTLTSTAANTMYYMYVTNKNAQVTQLVLTYESTGPTTYSVTYNGNGNTSGSVPTDATAYSSGATVTVLGNTGSLAKAGYTFGGWNTEDDGTGTDYDEDDTFSITANTTLYAKWNAKTITGLSKTGTPTKTTYAGGESFDPTGLTITATFNDSSEENVTTSVTWTPDPLTAGTTSVTGTYMGETVTVDGLTVTAAPGSAERPYTVAEAKAAIDAAGKTTINDKYVTGIVSQVDSYNSTYKSITYWISDDGTTTNQFEVYGGLSFEGGTAFSSKDDIQEGDIVTVHGDITYYSKNSIYEFASNNHLVSLYRQPTISADDVDIAADVLAGNITYSITNPDGSTLKAARKSGDWLTVGAVDSENSKVAFTATENTGAAREAVVTLTYGSVTKDVAITQGAAVAKYAVTFSAPSNGTLVVKRDEVAVSSGTELSDGTVLTIVTTADDGYRLVKWEYNEDNEGWNDGIGDGYTINGKPVAFRASFKGIVYHTITYSVNGVKTTDEVEDGEAVSFAAPESDVPTGYAFKGWSASEILIPQNSAPDYVSSATSSANVTYYAVLAKVVSSEEESWTETALEDLTSSDVFVIVGYNNIKYYGMTNDKGTGSAPSASNVTVSGSTLTGTIADEIKWNISGNSTDGYTFYPNGSTTTWLYCTDSNNGVRVGTNSNKVFTVDNGYLKNTATSRYVGIYSNTPDWRCYTTINNNIKDQTFSFYKHRPASTVYGDYCTLVPYTRDVTADNWGTLCLPYNANVEGATLYTFEGVDNTTTPTTAYFETAASVEGGKPYFFKATGTTLTATYTSSSAQAASSVNGAVGTLENISVTEGMYLLSNGQLVKCGTGCTLAANRAYIDMSEASVYGGGGAVKMQFDVTDGVATLRDGETMDEVFDLSGRRVVKPTKGLYIVNGKKILVK